MAKDPPDNDTIVIEEPALQETYTQIPDTILRYPHLSTGAKCVYGLFLHYARQQGACFPGQETLAADLGAGVRSVRRWIDELKAIRLIRVKRRGVRQTNVYYLTRWVESGLVREAKMADQALSGQNGRSRAAKMAALDRPKWPTKYIQREIDAEEGEGRANSSQRPVAIYEISEVTQNLARRHGWPVGVVKELNAALAVRARKADPELFRAALVKLQRNATSYAQELVGLFDAILGSQN